MGFIIGTAGHVDHGKSTLIRALTGIDPDRLREEKERGLTIDLGFAWIDLPRAGRAGIVDVPGHERFIKNMLAGAGGVDVALLVVAADEGVMPQTREHLDILRLLDVRSVVVAVTKTDLAEPDMTQLVEDEVRELLGGMGLPPRAVVRVSAVTRAGLEELTAALDEALSGLPKRSADGPARLPVDRVFTMTGFGTVVTGTLSGGPLRPGDALVILPGGRECRLRGVQVHGETVQVALPGQRVAANVTGVSRQEIERGRTLCRPGACVEAAVLDALVTVLSAAKALRHYARVRLHLGTAEVIARVALPPDTAIEPGKEGAVQIRCETPVAAAKGDRFVLRQYSPGVTVAGGVVVRAVQKRSKRSAISSEEMRRALIASPTEAALEALRAAPAGLRAPALAKRSGMSKEEAERVAAGFETEGKTRSLAGRYVAAEAWGPLVDALVAAVAAYHARQPTEPEMPKATWAAESPLADDPKAFDAAAAALEREGRIALGKTGVRLPDHRAQLSAKQEALLERIEGALRGIKVPTVSEIPRLLGLPEQAVAEILRLGRNVGRIVKVSEALYYPAGTVEEIKRLVREEVGRAGVITVARFRDLTDTSRKYGVPILEYLDEIGFTVRSGDERTLPE